VAAPLLLLLLLTLGAAQTTQTAQDPNDYARLSVTEQVSGTTDDLFAISAANPSVAWAIAANGTFTRTADGGKTWAAGRVRGGDSLTLASVHALSERSAYVVSSGPMRRTQVLRTDDGGITWKYLYVNVLPRVDWKRAAFWNAQRGIAVGQGRTGDFFVMATRDSGRTWDRVSTLLLPEPLPGELALPAGPTGLRTARSGRAWFTTSHRRLMRTTSYGTKQWKLSMVPVSNHDSAGVVSIAFRDQRNGIAFGGTARNATDTLVAVTNDGGESWTPRVAHPPLSSPIAAGAYVPGYSGPTVVLVGPGGAAFSRNNGVSWRKFSTNDYAGVVFLSRTLGWAVGARGRITKLAF
jgi:photosystem II stability/assembly factor-like uncharacterized protein